MTEVRGRYDEHGNVYDFIEYFLIHHAERLAASGHVDMADKLYAALDKYLTGEVDIIMRGGLPIIVTTQLPAIAEEIEDA